MQLDIKGSEYNKVWNLNCIEHYFFSIKSLFFVAKGLWAGGKVICYSTESKYLIAIIWRDEVQSILQLDFDQGKN